MTTAAQTGSPPVVAPLSRRHAARWAAVGIALALMLAAAGLLVVRRHGRTTTTPSTFRTARITEGPLRARITATGTLSALVTVQVGSQVSGRIQEIFVDHNSPVRKGQLLARIDPRLFASALEQVRAAQAVARANVTRTEALAHEAAQQQARGAALAQQGVTGQQELDSLEAAARSARAQQAAAQAQLTQAVAARRQAELNLAFTEIISPIDGVVISRNVDVGQTVAAAFQSPTLFLLAENLGKMQVDTSVAEADVGRLAPGMPATFTVDAYPAEVFSGRVRQVRNAPQTVQNVVTYNAVIDVDNPAFLLKPGMTANVTFVYASRERAVLVPNAALRFRPPADLAERAQRLDGQRAAGMRVLFVLEGGEPRAIAVRTGVTDGTSTELIDSPLRASTEVVTDVVTAAKGGPGSFGRVF